MGFKEKIGDYLEEISIKERIENYFYRRELLQEQMEILKQKCNRTTTESDLLEISNAMIKIYATLNFYLFLFILALCIFYEFVKRIGMKIMVLLRSFSR